MDSRIVRVTCVSMGNPHAIAYSVDGKPVKVRGWLLCVFHQPFDDPYCQHVLLSCCLHCCLTFGTHICERKRPQCPCPSSNLQTRLTSLLMYTAPKILNRRLTPACITWVAHCLYLGR